jgi:hypothetical protein
MFLVCLALTLSFGMYLRHTPTSFDIKLKFNYNKLTVSDKILNSNTESGSIKENLQLYLQQLAKDNTSVSAPCRLPSLDPLHKTVKDLMTNLGGLDCGTLQSSFRNNTLHIEGDDIVSVSYRIIIRPAHNDFGSSLSESVSVPNSFKSENSPYKQVKQGKDGLH